ncbi:MAG: TetR/AcrR family transcriptional regulator [Dehalococcoidia bacterium]
MARTKSIPPVTHDDVLQTAAKMFRERGYLGMSMHDLSAALGLQKASLYYHVKSKEELVREILVTGMGHVISRMREVVRSQTTPSQQLRQALRVQVEAMCGDYAYVQATAMTDANMLSPDARAEFIRLRDDFEHLVRSIVEAGIELHEFPECDVGLTVKAILGMCGWLVVWYDPKGRLSPTEIADRFGDLILGGLLVRPVTNDGL